MRQGRQQERPVGFPFRDLEEEMRERARGPSREEGCVQDERIRRENATPLVTYQWGGIGSLGTDGRLLLKRLCPLFDLATKCISVDTLQCTQESMCSRCTSAPQRWKACGSNKQWPQCRQTILHQAIVRVCMLADAQSYINGRERKAGVNAVAEGG